MLDLDHLINTLRILAGRPTFYLKEIENNKYKQVALCVEKLTDIEACEIWSSIPANTIFNPRSDYDITTPTPVFLNAINCTKLKNELGLLKEKIVGTIHKVVIYHKKVISLEKPADYRYVDIYGKRYYVDINFYMSSTITITNNDVKIEVRPKHTILGNENTFIEKYISLGSREQLTDIMYSRLIDPDKLKHLKISPIKQGPSYDVRSTELR